MINTTTGVVVVTCGKHYSLSSPSRLSEQQQRRPPDLCVTRRVPVKYGSSMLCHMSIAHEPPVHNNNNNNIIPVLQRPALQAHFRPRTTGRDRCAAVVVPPSRRVKNIKNEHVLGTEKIGLFRTRDETGRDRAGYVVRGASQTRVSGPRAP